MRARSHPARAKPTRRACCCTFWGLGMHKNAWFYKTSDPLCEKSESEGESI